MKENGRDTELSPEINYFRLRVVQAECRSSYQNELFMQKYVQLTH